MTKIIIQGHGIVGQSTELFLTKFNSELDIKFNDPYKNISASAESWEAADYVIVCVNTNLDNTLAVPENSTTNIDDAINEALSKGFKGKIILRSTIGIACVQELMKQLGDNLIVWPEYIRESTWQTDSANPSFVIVGGEGAETFADLVKTFKGPTFITDPLEAMIAKLSTNTFLSMKVIFANQVERLCAATGGNYDIVKVLLENEGRLGSSHWGVPGLDGKNGFGGKCFPKDVKTFEAALIKTGQHIDLIRAITDLNESMRPNDEQL